MAVSSAYYPARAIRDKDRYGAHEVFQSAEDVLRVVQRLLEELEDEQFEEPDDEHDQIAISNKHWSLTVQVSGLMVLGDMRPITGSPDDDFAPALYLRAESRDEAARLMVLLAEGRIEEVRAAHWTRYEDAGPHVADLFRASSTDRG